MRARRVGIFTLENDEIFLRILPELAGKNQVKLFIDIEKFRKIYGGNLDLIKDLNLIKMFSFRKV